MGPGSGSGMPGPSWAGRRLSALGFILRGPGPVRQPMCPHREGAPAPLPGVGLPPPGGGASVLRVRSRREDTESVPITVVLAEDSYLMREGVSRLLETDPGLELVATSEDLPQLVGAVRDRRPDAGVTDIRMPPRHTDEGIQAAESFRDTNPGM